MALRIGTPERINAYICLENIISSSKETLLKPKISLTSLLARLSVFFCADAEIDTGVIFLRSNCSATAEVLPASMMPLTWLPSLLRPIYLNDAIYNSNASFAGANNSGDYRYQLTSTVSTKRNTSSTVVTPWTA